MYIARRLGSEKLEMLAKKIERNKVRHLEFRGRFRADSLYGFHHYNSNR